MMAIWDMLKGNKRNEMQPAVPVQAAPQAPVPVQKMAMSQETLDLLIQGREALLERRQKLAAAMQETEALIQQQEGGIQVLRGLLGG